MVVALVLLAAVVLYGLVQCVMRLSVAGTWTTQDGSEKLKIRLCYLVYTYDEIEIKERHLYKVRSLNFEDKDFSLKPTKFTRNGILGMYEEIKYRDRILIGGILISDVGYKQTEFRKNWDAVEKK